MALTRYLLTGTTYGVLSDDVLTAATLTAEASSAPTAAYTRSLLTGTTYGVLTGGSGRWVKKTGAYWDQESVPFTGTGSAAFGFSASGTGALRFIGSGGAGFGFSMAGSGAVRLPRPTPPERTARIAAENRTVDIPAENRTVLIAAEDRTVRIQ